MGASPKPVAVAKQVEIQRSTETSQLCWKRVAKSVGSRAEAEKKGYAEKIIVTIACQPTYYLYVND